MKVLVAATNYLKNNWKSVLIFTTAVLLLTIWTIATHATNEPPASFLTYTHEESNIQDVPLNQRVVSSPKEVKKMKKMENAQAIENEQREQKARTESTCREIEAGHYNVSLSAMKTRTLQKGIVDHFHKVVYCDIGKTGTTSWIGLYKILTKQERSQRRQYKKNHSYKWYTIRKKDRWRQFKQLAVNRLSRGNETGREVKDGLPDPRKEYFKFIVVRHPLERLASAYYSRVVDGRKRQCIIDIKSLVRTNIPRDQQDNSVMTFAEFLQYVATPDINMKHVINYHWRSYQSICEPCSIHYDYVAHLETLEKDLKQLLPKVDAKDLINRFPEKNVGPEGSSKYREMYHDVPRSILQPVLNKYQADADMFGYTFDDYINKR